MRIAIATDDLKTVRKGHFGDAEYFVIFEVIEGKLKLVEKRENPYTDEKLGIKEHENPEKAKMIAEFLKDCKVFIAHAMGRKNRKILEERGVIPFFAIPGTSVEEAALKYLAQGTSRE